MLSLSILDILLPMRLTSHTVLTYHYHHLQLPLVQSLLKTSICTNPSYCILFVSLMTDAMDYHTDDFFQAVSVFAVKFIFHYFYQFLLQCGGLSYLSVFERIVNIPLSYRTVC